MPLARRLLTHHRPHARARRQPEHLLSAAPEASTSGPTCRDPCGGCAVVEEVADVGAHDPRSERSRPARRSLPGASRLGRSDEPGVAAEHGPDDGRLGPVAPARQLAAERLRAAR